MILNSIVLAEDGTLKRVRVRRATDRTGASPILPADLLAFRNQVGIADGQQWGGTPVLDTDFSAGLESFAVNSGVTVANADGVSDGSTTHDDVLKITTDTTAVGHIALRAGTFTAGRRYRVDVTYYIPSGMAFGRIRIGAASVSAPPATIDLATVGAWTTASGELNTVSATSLYAALITAAGSTTFQGIADQAAYIKDLKITELGVRKFLTHSQSLDFGSIAAGASADLTMNVAGAATNDSVSLGLPAAPTAGIIFQAFVSAANVVTVRATNITGSAVDPAAATYRVAVLGF